MITRTVSASALLGLSALAASAVLVASGPAAQVDAVQPTLTVRSVTLPPSMSSPLVLAGSALGGVVVGAGALAGRAQKNGGRTR